MNIIHSSLNMRGEEFLTNRNAMRALVDELRARSDIVRLGGGASASARHKVRGKLLARERIDQLVDAGSAFLEIAQLAANGVYDDDAPSAGLVRNSSPRIFKLL